MVEAIVAEMAQRYASRSPASRKWGSWIIEANIIKDLRRGRDGVTLHTGTPKFRGGAKVHVVGVYWGAVSSIVVVGRHRMDQQYLGCAITIELLENLRPKVLYSPGVARVIAHKLATSNAAADCFYATQEEAAHAASTARRKFAPHWRRAPPRELPVDELY